MIAGHWCGKLGVLLLLSCSLLTPSQAYADEVMSLVVDTDIGQVTWINPSGLAFNIDYYEITSVHSALDPVDWFSLQEQDRDEFPAGDGTGSGWEQAGGTSAKVLSESFPLGQSTFAIGASIDLGAAFTLGGDEDLVFRYAVVPSSPAGDYNDDNLVDAADYTAWRDHLGQSFLLPNDPTLGTVTADDYTEWKTNFGDVGGPTSPSILVTGSVEYLPPGSTAAPEPSPALLFAVGLASLTAAAGRWR